MEIQYFTSLRELHLDNNPFLSGTVPKEIHTLKYLEELNLDNTNVTEHIDEGLF